MHDENSLTAVNQTNYMVNRLHFHPKQFYSLTLIHSGWELPHRVLIWSDHQEQFGVQRQHVDRRSRGLNHQPCNQRTTRSTYWGVPGTYYQQHLASFQARLCPAGLTVLQEVGETGQVVRVTEAPHTDAQSSCRLETHTHFQNTLSTWIYSFNKLKTTKDY